MPVQNVRLRATDKLSADMAKRLTYRTRRMLPNDDERKKKPLTAGEEFEAPWSDAETYIRAGFAEPLEGEKAPAAARVYAAAKKKPDDQDQQEPRARARQRARQQPEQQDSEQSEQSEQSQSESQPASQQQPQSQSEPQEQEHPTSLEDMTRSEMIELAEKHGVELPPGYNTRDELVGILQKAGIAPEG